MRRLKCLHLFRLFVMYQTCYVGILFYIVILELCIGAKAANTNSMDDEKVKKGTMDIYHYDLCDHI